MFNIDPDAVVVKFKSLFKTKHESLLALTIFSDLLLLFISSSETPVAAATAGRTKDGSGLLFNLILEYHGIGKSKSDEYFKLLKIDNPNFSLDNENDIYKQFSKLFNLNFLDSIIINHIKHFLIDFLIHQN